MGEIINMDGRKDSIGDKKRDPERKKKIKKILLKSIPAIVTAIITALISTMINRIPLESELTERDKTIETQEAEKRVYEQTIETQEAEKRECEQMIETLKAEKMVHEKTIEALAAEIEKNKSDKLLADVTYKENEVQMQASYLMCDIKDVFVAQYEGYNFQIVLNDISHIYNKYDVYLSGQGDITNIEELLDVNNIGANTNYEVVFLLLESFGNHSIKDLCIDTTILKYDENIEHSHYAVPKFAEYPETENAEKYTFELKDRRVGEKYLIPLLIKYDNFDGTDEMNPNSHHLYVYKEIYRPDVIRYTDGITGEEKKLEVRDILNDYLEIDMHFVGLG